MSKNYLLKARSLALFFVLLFSVQFLQAQTAADYKINTTTTPSTCQQNGIITIDVAKANGDALNMTDIAFL